MARHFSLTIVINDARASGRLSGWINTINRHNTTILDSGGEDDISNAKMFRAENTWGRVEYLISF